MTGGATFRDPAGSVSVTRHRVIRTVFPEGIANLNACLNSPAARRFVDSGDMIATYMPETTAAPRPDREVVEHPRIPFIGYPYEWTPAMLHTAARLTLDLCSAFIEEGLGLKDATPLNILFRGPRPVFIDVLSIEERSPLDPIWLADAQFARTFLIPLLLNKRTGQSLQELFLLHRDGVAPEDAVQRLPGMRRWFPPDLGLVTLTARGARLENDSLYRPRQTRDAGEARFVLSHHFRGLRKKLDHLEPVAITPPPQVGVSTKRAFIEQTLRETKPSRVLDIDSHTGEFSLLAASTGASVIAIDSNPDSVTALWRSAQTAGADILPLVVDFARPTPAVGWRCQEHAGFLERAEGFFDCVLLLDSIHRLMVTDQIPPAQIFEVAASLTTRWLIVEYIGPGDPAFHRLARGRDALYRHFTRTAFDECASQSFELMKTFDIPTSERAICLLRRKS